MMVVRCDGRSVPRPPERPVPEDEMQIDRRDLNLDSVDGGQDHHAGRSQDVRQSCREVIIVVLAPFRVVRDHIVLVHDRHHALTCHF